MMNLPKLNSYGNYSSDNYGAHALQVSFDNLVLYYSYKTIIAFSTPGDLVVTKNDWGNTTGKHLNLIDGGRKSDRLDRDEFEKKLNKVLVEKKLINEDE